MYLDLKLGLTQPPTNRLQMVAHVANIAASHCRFHISSFRPPSYLYIAARLPCLFKAFDHTTAQFYFLADHQIAHVSSACKRQPGSSQFWLIREDRAATSVPDATCVCAFARLHPISRSVRILWKPRQRKADEEKLFSNCNAAQPEAAVQASTSLKPRSQWWTVPCVKQACVAKAESFPLLSFPISLQFMVSCKLK